jgi:hypothetical protein
MQGMKCITVAACAMLCASGGAVRADPALPNAPLSVIYGPVTVNPGQPESPRFSMVVVEKDPAAYPIRMAYSQAADYTIRVVVPGGVVQPAPGAGYPPLILTKPPTGQRAPLVLRGPGR